MAATPDELVIAGHLTLRRYRPSDAAALQEAVTESLDDLRPWMPWAADEPLTVTEKDHLIGTLFDAGWDEATSFIYGAFLDGDVVGGCGLHPRIGPGGMEIGYWVRTGHGRRGIATTAAAALVDAAFRLDEVTHVEIHHDEANIASAGIPAKLGFRLIATVTDEPAAPGETGVSYVWRLGRTR